MADTTARGYRFPEGADAPNVAQDIENLASDIDADVAAVDAAAVAAAAANVKVIFGKVAAAGTAFGTGFTVNRTGTGVYVLTFTDPFAGAPVVLALPSEVDRIVTGLGNAGSTGTVATVNRATGAAVDADFGFLAIGAD